ncbi:thioredoxin family protein [Myroides odoratus]|uniref:thioredoxin family protein n=1 Tax=Myroides odoratus TaxID=256 RepID=UPI0039AEB6EF
MTKAIFYHAGCSVCVSAEKDILNLIPENQVEVIHLGEAKTKVNDAVNAGVQSVPALVLSNGNVLHINFGASMEDIK